MSDNMLKWLISFFWALVVVAVAAMIPICVVYLLESLEWIGAIILAAIIVVGIANSIRSDLDD